MKLYVNKGQYGWYTTAKNRNDKEDKAYVNLFFPKNSDPADGTKEIDVQEWQLSCYKGKVGMTIFKYQIGAYASEVEGVPEKDVKIEPNDLPFF